MGRILLHVVDHDPDPDLDHDPDPDLDLDLDLDHDLDLDLDLDLDHDPDPDHDLEKSYPTRKSVAVIRLLLFLREIEIPRHHIYDCIDRNAHDLRLRFDLCVIGESIRECRVPTARILNPRGISKKHESFEHPKYLPYVVVRDRPNEHLLTSGEQLRRHRVRFHFFAVIARHTCVIMIDYFIGAMP